jgi:hypothetical protein
LTTKEVSNLYKAKHVKTTIKNGQDKQNSNIAFLLCLSSRKSDERVLKNAGVAQVE